MSTVAHRYRLLEQLGRGGMGVVWRARDERLGRDVALKVLHSWVADDPDLRERFDREASALARLEHPNVVRLYDVLEDGGQTVLVLELVEGDGLHGLASGRRLGWDEVRRYCAPVAAGLAHAHARGVVHRDLTPSNVLVERATGRVVVTDFGLARLVRSSTSLPVSGVLAGTPEYWAPEQAAGEPTGPATDLYALGCPVLRSPGEHAGDRRSRRAAHEPREAEVRDHDAPGAPLDQDVRGRQVAVDDPARVCVREAGGDRRAVASHLVPFEPAAGRERVESLAVDELEHEHGLLLVLDHVVQTDDVGMLEAGERRGLSVEALAQLRILGDPAVQHLQRDVAPEALVARAPDDAHPAPAELLVQAISVGNGRHGSLHGVLRAAAAHRPRNASPLSFGECQGPPPLGPGRHAPGETARSARTTIDAAPTDQEERAHMAAIEPGKIRNVAVVGHRGTGKTSLVEALLFQTGEVNRLGSIEAGTTVSDSDEDEQKRQLSISLSLTHTSWQGRKLNLAIVPATRPSRARHAARSASSKGRWSSCLA